MKNTILALILTCFGINMTAQCVEPNSLVKVYKTRTANYEYVIFKLKKNFTGTYTVVPVTTVTFDTGVGDPPPTVAGCKFLSVTFNDIFWMCATNESTGLYTTRIKDVVNTGHFEGIISYAVGYQCPASKFLGHYAYDDGGYKKVVLRFRR